MNDLATEKTSAALTLPTRYELGAMSTQQLRSALAQSLTMSVQHLAHLATIWGELERRGEDLSDLRTGMTVYLPQIAAGRLDAGAVIRFAGQPTVLRSLAGLPLAQQQQLAQGATVQVLTVDAAGEYTAADMPVYHLTATQARMVFDGDNIRSPQEQRATLESQRVARTARVRPGGANRVRYDASADVIRIGGSSATVGEVTAALAEAARQREPEPEQAIVGAEQEFETVAFRLTAVEHAQLKIRAAEAKLSRQDYMHAMLVRTALL